MIRVFIVILWVAALAGCSSGRTYQMIGSPDPMGGPLKYPLNYPLCQYQPGGGVIVVPLRIRIYGASMPDPVHLMAARKRNADADGCKYRQGPGTARPLFIEEDAYGGGSNGWLPLDKTGKGYWSSVAYMIQLLNAAGMEKEEEERRRIGETRKINLAKFGETFRDSIEIDELILIYGLQWRHRVVAKYKVRDPEGTSSGELLEWRESYEHQIDASHVLRYLGRYDADVVLDSAWLASRRDLLRRMVEAVRIEQMTPVEMEAARAVRSP